MAAIPPEECRYLGLGRHFRHGNGGLLVLTAQPTSVPIIYVRTPELKQVFTVEGAILAAENREGMNSKRGRREEGQ